MINSKIKGKYFTKVEFIEKNSKKEAEKLKDKKEKQSHQVLLEKYGDIYTLTVFEGGHTKEKTS